MLTGLLTKPFMPAFRQGCLPAALAIGCQTDDRRAPHWVRLGPDKPGGRQSIHLRHHHVHQDNVIGDRAHRFHRLCPVSNRINTVAHALHHAADDQTVGAVVLNQQDPQPPHDATGYRRRIANMRAIAGRVFQQNFKVECAALAWRALDRQRAAHALNQTATDRQPQATAAEPA